MIMSKLFYRISNNISRDKRIIMDDSHEKMYNIKSFKFL